MTPVLTPTTKRSWHRPESRVDLCDDDNDDDDCLDGSGEEDHGTEINFTCRVDQKGV